MNRIPPRNPRLRLAPNLYEHLRQQVLRRDGWRCQGCGAIANLEVHRKELRGQSGDDAEPNLITLCTACHAERAWRWLAHSNLASSRYAHHARLSELAPHCTELATDEKTLFAFEPTSRIVPM